ncbi:MULTISPECIES: proline iminopeptidase [Terrabacteria group]|uniref:proline iminopeptidase n=1 Tax=Bacillati TaxID=1783272 RepID=UPI001C6DE8FF|nr:MULTISPECIES: proline iminopeptidase-family hydrolase [Terrabacteria group]MBW9212037.1 proline iminopeptidase-family hydrolase [Trueperella sp. zg.1013]
MEIKEGYMPFKDYKTYYRMLGNPKKPTIVFLHGGPGSTHNYFEVLDGLAEEGYCLVMYDQLGCGLSYLDQHPELWTMETWLEELKALKDYLHLEEFHLLGQSWGGMLALEYVLHHQAKAVKSLILSSTLSSASLWASEQHRWIRYLSMDDQKAIQEAEESGDFSSLDYQKANEHFMKAHCGDTANSPWSCLQREKKSGTESYLVAWGENEYCPTGTLSHFEVSDELQKIQMPTLIISGTEDLCSPLVAKTMFDQISNAKWELVPDARHMVFMDQWEQYQKIMKNWLRQF